jgi:hypothetical protein
MGAAHVGYVGHLRGNTSEGLIRDSYAELFFLKLYKYMQQMV